MKKKINKTFNVYYAKFYDKIYSKKNYDEEVNFLNSIFLKNKKDNLKIIDIGCGTGQHLLRLLKLGYDVIGVDQSDKMTGLAKKRLEENGFEKTKIFKMEAKDVHKIPMKFDFVILMFNVVGYIEDLKSFFSNLKTILNLDAVIIFDFWNGEAVIKEKPQPSTKIFKLEKSLLIKKSKGEIIKPNLIKVEIELEIEEQKKSFFKKETHFVRYYFFEELKKMFLNLGYKITFLNKHKINKIIKSKSGWEAVCLLKNEK